MAGRCMSDITDPVAWVERAEEDFEVARVSVRRRRPLTNSACSHAQQCAEKYLKAVLVARGATFARVHDNEGHLLPVTAPGSAREQPGSLRADAWFRLNANRYRSPSERRPS